MYVQAQGFDGYRDRWYGQTQQLYTRVSIRVADGEALEIHEFLVSTADGTGRVEVAAFLADHVSPATEVCIQLQPQAPRANEPALEVCNAKKGVYVFTGVKDGIYQIYNTGKGSTAQQYYPGTTNANSPTETTTVDAGESVKVEFLLHTRSAVHGYVLDGDGKPVIGARVDLMWGPPSGGQVALEYTDANGRYVAPWSSCGSSTSCFLQLRVSAGSENQYVWFGDSATREGAAPISASGYSELAPITLPSEAPGNIRGVIEIPEPWGGSTACVVALEGDTGVASDCGPVGSEFVLSGLPAGDYGLCVSRKPSNGEFHWCFDPGDDYAVLGGLAAHVPQIEFAVAAGATTVADLDFEQQLTVTVGSDEGDAIVGGCVDVRRADKPSAPPVATSCDGADGVFEFDFTSAVTRFRVYAYGFEGQGPAAFDVAGPYVDAEVIHGSDEDVDVSLAPWGTVGGTITLPEGSESEIACVDFFGDDSYDRACLEPGGGSYSISLPDDDYLALFTSDSAVLATEWYDDAASYENATAVTVESGSVASVNAVLADAGVIAGVLELSSGAPATSVCVEAYLGSGEFVRRACTDSGGAYMLDAIVPGTYRLYFDSSGAATPGWNGGADLASATDVAVSASATTTVDATLASQSFFLGHIVLPVGASQDGAIYAYDAQTGNYAAGAVPDSSGDFVLYVGAGSYNLLFEDFSGAANEWYNNAASLGSAKSVTARPAGTNLGNIVLSGDGAFEGNFYNIGSSVPESACATAYFAKTGHWAASTCGSRGDRFTLDNLAPGTYRVRLWTENGNERWLGGSSWSSATKVKVARGQVKWLQFDPIAFNVKRTFVKGEVLQFGMVFSNHESGTATISAQGGDGESRVVKTGIAVADGVGLTTFAPARSAQHSVTFGNATQTVYFEKRRSTVQVALPDTYVSGVPFTVTARLDAPGNGPAKLEQRIGGGKWKTVKHGVKIVDGVGSRAITLNGGGTAEFRVTFDGVQSEEVSLTRDEITFDAAGGGDFFKGGAYDVDFTVTSDETFAGDVDLWVKKGSKKWTKAGKVTFVDGAGTATVKPSAKTTLYQLRAGPDRSAVVTFTKVNPTITLAFGDGDDGTHVVGDSFDLNVTIAGPDASTVPLYTGNVVLKIRKPGKSWSKVSGGVNIVDGVGTITLNQLKGKRDYQVVFGGKKSHIVRATGTSA